MSSTARHDPTRPSRPLAMRQHKGYWCLFPARGSVQDIGCVGTAPSHQGGNLGTASGISLAQQRIYCRSVWKPWATHPLSSGRATWPTALCTNGIACQQLYDTFLTELTNNDVSSFARKQTPHSPFWRVPSHARQRGRSSSLLSCIQWGGRR